MTAIVITGFVEEVYDDVTDALRAATSDPKVDVWLHADSCKAEQPTADCPCKPFLIQKGAE